MTKRRAVKCSDVCCVCDTYDKDCDIMGEHHLHQRICPIFKEQDADLWKKLFGEKKKMTNNKIPLFKTFITEVDKEYAREQTECPFIDDLDGMSFVDKNGCLCVWFDGEPELDTIVHESVHLANMIIDRTGMMYTTKEDELLAYLVSYIFNELRWKNEMEKECGL